MARILSMIAAVATALLLASCSKSSKPDEFRSDRGNLVFYAQSYYIDVEAPLDDVWATALAALSELEWVVDVQSDATGEITTRETTIGTNRDRYACRQWPGSRTRVDEMAAKLSLHLASEDGRVTRIRALAGINGRYVYLSSSGEERIGGWWPCTSTGELESELFDAILVRLEPIEYDAPVYRKWKSR